MRNILFLLPILLFSLALEAAGLPDGFVDVRVVVPTIKTDIRYHGAHNFLGTRVEGYEAPRCILTREAAEGLARAQASLEPQGLSLKVFDCYRPQRAVNQFLRWAREPEDPTLRAAYYPNLHKMDLLRQVYIADKSGHSRGSTVDVTIVWTEHPTPPLPRQRGRVREGADEGHDGCAQSASTRGSAFDMGSGFDCFDPISHTDSTAVTPEQRANRQLLRAVMRRAGFFNYEREWWHYILKNEPYSETLFDFPVR